MQVDMIRHEVETTYDKVKSLAGWSVTKNVVLTITSYYVTATEEFNAVNFSRAMASLKERAGWFSPLRGHLLPMMAAFMTQSANSMDEEADLLFVKQRALKQAGFRNSIHSYLAALLMSDDPKMFEEEAERAKKLYDAMKKQHFFLTSEDDYAYSMLLGKKGEDPELHARAMRVYYDALRKEGFRAGNELQWLSQVMTYTDITFHSRLVKRAAEVFKMLGDDLKVKPIHYPMIGFLTVFDVGDQKISEVISITNELERSKQFKWNREMALSLACGIMLHHLTESANQVGVSMATSFEMVLQAQQAVMAVTVASVAISSATSSSDV
ncbi:DUF4003 family protein [Sporosarcina thermotolerans]|uniref:DUF4003 family protein n=1 Tax=Sporosarcina thermotolerans TaxID=633404 RepID=A0AAW9A9M5_9BACL|nr:DUF4003 family protein [Sporosarcina thermotolerans]MDW0116605.1 DUF4003 family protein [Sporosarcina thermotolerans]